MADQKISALTELTVPPDPTDELVVVDKSDTTMAASGTDKRLQFSNFFDWAEAGDLSVIEPDDAAAAGTSTEIARADHQHAVAAASAGTIQPDDAAAEGSATSFARSDHKHAIVAAAAGAITGTAAEGSSTSFARADHDHGLPDFGVHSVIPGGMMDLPISSVSGGVNTYLGLRVVLLSKQTVTGIRYKVGGTSSGNVRAALYDAGGGTRLANRTTNVAQATANSFQNATFDATYDAAPGTYFALLWFSSATATFWSCIFSTVGATGTDAAGPPATVSAATSNSYRPILTTY